MAFLWQRHRPIVTNRLWAQAWATSPALLGRARQPRSPWQRLEASMWTAAKKDTQTKTTDTKPPLTPDAPKPEPTSASGGAKTAPGRLPGRIADVLGLEDTQRVPIVTYSPTEELFTMNEEVLREALRTNQPLLESRVAVNKYPSKWYLAEYYLKMRETMVSKPGVFHKRWRGNCASAAGRFLSMNDAANQFCGSLGRKDWERDPAREINTYKDFRTFDAKSTTSHVEYLRDGQAAAVWVSIAPERYDGAGGGGFPAVKALHYYTWANRHPPWKYLLKHLRESPSLQLRAPSISPTDENYELYPDGRRPKLVAPVNGEERFRPENDYFVHFMPLLMETFGPGGRRINRLWTKERRNNNLPIVLCWQDQYAWFIWRNGPEGPLELQHTGWWLPQIQPGHPNYARQEKQRIEMETAHNMPPYGKSTSSSTGVAPTPMRPKESPPNAEPMKNSRPPYQARGNLQRWQGRGRKEFTRRPVGSEKSGGPREKPTTLEVLRATWQAERP